MKKLLIWLLVVLAASFSATSALAGADPATGIVDSKHDMRLYAGANGGIVDAEGRVCAYCHTPHHSLEDMDADYLPLWSHELTAQVFQEYSSATLNANILDPVAGPSRLCMSCHDGVVAIDSYYNLGGTATLTEGDAFGEIGIALDGNMTNDHPVGFDYTDVGGAGATYGGADAADPEIWGAGRSLTAINSKLGTIGDLLYDDGYGRKLMTCASCHDVHNGPSAVETYFLYADQNDSEFCRMCHAK